MIQKKHVETELSRKKPKKTTDKILSKKIKK
jgi:hypothetical protein